MKYLEDSAPDQLINFWIGLFVWFIVGVVVTSWINIDSEKRKIAPMTGLELLIYPFIWFVPAIVYALFLLTKGKK